MTTLFRLGSAEFKSFRPTKRVVGAFFTLSAAKSVDDKTRFSCVVSKKVSPKAVVRNTVKRRARATMRAVPSPAATTLVLTAKADSAKASFAEIRDDIARLVSRL